MIQVKNCCPETKLLSSPLKPKISGLRYKLAQSTNRWETIHQMICNKKICQGLIPKIKTKPIRLFSGKTNKFLCPGFEAYEDRNCHINGH